ncbi:hypothetical protein ACKC4X_21735, partial [Aeromonas veronii]
GLSHLVFLYQANSDWSAKIPQAMYDDRGWHQGVWSGARNFLLCFFSTGMWERQMSIKAGPEDERPSEKLLRQGPAA